MITYISEAFSRSIPTYLVHIYPNVTGELTITCEARYNIYKPEHVWLRHAYRNQIGLNTSKINHFTWLDSTCHRIVSIHYNNYPVASNTEKWSNNVWVKNSVDFSTRNSQALICMFGILDITQDIKEWTIYITFNFRCFNIEPRGGIRL